MTDRSHRHLWLRFWLLLALGLLLIWAVPSQACDGKTHAIVNLASYHLDRSKDYEEFNPGIGIERECGGKWNDLRLLAGLYRNSQSRTSIAGGVEWVPVKAGPVLLGGFAGLFTGYDASIVPGGGLIAMWERVGGFRYGVNLIYVPKVQYKGNVQDATVAVQVKIAL